MLTGEGGAIGRGIKYGTIWGGAVALALAVGIGGPVQRGAAGRQATAEPLPAFLDAFDEIRVWLPEPVRLSETQGTARVWVGGREAAVSGVIGGERLPGTRDPNRVVIAGTLQAALGGAAWDPAGETTRMTQTALDVFELTVFLKPGRYAYKVARGGSWEENYGAGFVPGGANIALEVRQARIVRFVVDFGARTIRDSVNHPGAVTAPAAVPPRPPQSGGDADAKYASVRVKLARRLTADDLTRPITARVGEGLPRPVFAREVLSDRSLYYAGSDLGTRWTPTATTFKVWSPVARAAYLRLFDSPTSPVRMRIPLKRGGAGVWYAALPGNRRGTYYQYEFDSYGKTWTAADIYGTAASADSTRSLVVDLARSNPVGWPAPRPFAGKKPTDAVLYELHVRDFTISPQSGIRPAWRGKYLGLTQAGTRLPGSDFATGLDYLKNLGVTHVHLLPIQNYNPAHSRVYNWGYETTLFNVPEEQYATRPDDAFAVIRETKAMVMALQRRGIGVVMDVVYNHTVPSGGAASAFWATVPYYYFRTNDRGDLLNESGVGNALHDERPMVRKFVRESLAFWTREYRIDGFRFDLLGMFAPETVRDLGETIRRANPSAVIYGEPWTGGGPTRFGKGDQRGMPVAVFNDHFRNVLRGELDGPRPGFALGGATDRRAIEQALSGSLDDFADSPTETVNYVSAHDNMTFWDRVSLSLPAADRATRAAAVKLAHAAILLSPGIPFIEGGVEMGRTKGMNPNSYNGGDAVNGYDWPRAPQYRDVTAYLRGLIALRRAHPAFRLATRAGVKRAFAFLPADRLPPDIVAYTLAGDTVGDPWKRILVVFHGGAKPQTLTLPPGEWRVAVDGKHAGTRPLRTVSGQLTLDALSAAVLFQR